MTQPAMGGNLPRVGTHAQAVSLPRGANFIAIRTPRRHRMARSAHVGTRNRIE